MPSLPQNTTGHGHGHNTAPHVGPHGHNLTVQSQSPTVVQGHVHPPTSMTSTQGQQFQRLKVQPHKQIHNFKTPMETKEFPNDQIKMLTSLSTKQVFYIKLIDIFDVGSYIRYFWLLLPRLKMPCPTWIK